MKVESEWRAGRGGVGVISKGRDQRFQVGGRRKTEGRDMGGGQPSMGGLGKGMEGECGWGQQESCVDTKALPDLTTLDHKL